MPFPPGPAKPPWREWTAGFLSRKYGVPAAGPEAALWLDPGLQVESFGRVLPFDHSEDVLPPPAPAGRAFLARRILEVQAAGGALDDRPVRRMAGASRDADGQLAFRLAAARLHDDLACGQAMAAELFGTLWDEHERDDAEERVAARLKVRGQLAPDAAALQDPLRRVVRLRVEVALRVADGLLLELRPATAGRYPRLWGLPCAASVEAADETASQTVARASREKAWEAPAIDGGTPVRVAWDLITGDLVVLVGGARADTVPAVPGRTTRVVPPAGAAEFLRRAPVVPTAAAILGGLIG